jgi:hypothetical protein
VTKVNKALGALGACLLKAAPEYDIGRTLRLLDGHVKLDRAAPPSNNPRLTTLWGKLDDGAVIDAQGENTDKVEDRK